jgi:hypothetical protein
VALAAGVLAGAAPATAHLDARPVAASSAGSFSLAYVRVAGSSRINRDGVTCYSGPVSFGIALKGPKAEEVGHVGQVLTFCSRSPPSATS